MASRIGSLIAITLLAGTGTGELGASPVRVEPFMRGVVVSCPRAGQIWGTVEMSEALVEITELGADWISIHPYAWVARDGEIRQRPAADTGFLDEAVRRMRRAGVRIFWKPHLGYWGSFDWRGSISFVGEAAWARFFAGYRDFIVDQARFAEAHGVELFAVGIEYESTMHREADWRRIIREVRAVYSGRLTYAANWDGLEKVRFWDAVDLIGVHAYFPISSEAAPSRETVVAGWIGHLRSLEALAERHGKPILFAEIGYNRAANAASEPWSHGSRDSEENRRLRRMLMEVALETVEPAPHIAGMFWWKWMPGARTGRDFSLKEEEARAALRRRWAAASKRAPVAPTKSSPQR